MNPLFSNDVFMNLAIIHFVVLNFINSHREFNTFNEHRQKLQQVVVVGNLAFKATEHCHPSDIPIFE